MNITNYSCQRRAGFTFIELLVTVTLIAVLSAIGIVSYSSAQRRSRDGKRKADLEIIRSALEMYRADEDGYPDDLYDLETDYIRSIPIDPRTGSGYGYSPAASPVTSYNLCANDVEVELSPYCVQNP